MGRWALSQAPLLTASVPCGVTLINSYRAMYPLQPLAMTYLKLVDAFVAADHTFSTLPVKAPLVAVAVKVG
jgi:hypothetical protein